MAHRRIVPHLESDTQNGHAFLAGGEHTDSTEPAVFQSPQQASRASNTGKHAVALDAGLGTKSRRSSAPSQRPSSFYEDLHKVDETSSVADESLVPWWVFACWFLLAGAFVVCCVLLLRFEEDEVARSKRNAFVSVSSDLLSAMRVNLERAQDDSTLLGRFIELKGGSAQLNRTDFSRFAGEVVRNIGAQAAEWIPHVQHAQRADFEAAAAADLADVPNLRSPIEFVVRNSSGQLERAPDRSVYFPVYFVEPIVGNEPAVLFDLGSSEARVAAMNRSRALNASVASEAVRLVQAAQSEAGVLLFTPVFDAGHNLEGFGLIVLRVNALLAGAVEGLSPEHVSVHIYDVTDSLSSCPVQEVLSAEFDGNSDLTFSEFSPDTQSCADLQRKRAAHLSGPRSEFAFQSLTVGTRQWELVVTRLATFESDVPVSQLEAAIGFAAAMLLVGIVLAVLLLLRGRRILHTSQHVHEERELQKLAAEEANRSKTEFFAFLCHELRNPLFAIVASGDDILETLHESGPSFNTSEVEHMARTIQSCSSLMTTIISDVLDLNKLEQGKLNFESLLIDVPPLAQRVHQMFLAVAESKSITLAIDVPDNMPAIWSDPTRLSQILINFTSNALKFTPPGSEVRIFVGFDTDADAQPFGNPIEPSNAPDEPTNVNVPTRSDPDHDVLSVVIGVQDWGHGISQDALPRLFEPYAQANAKVSRTKGGTGLGLAIIRHIVTILGGIIDVHTAQGDESGSTFSVSFPAYAATAPEVQTLQKSLSYNNIFKPREIELDEGLPDIPGSPAPSVQPPVHGDALKKALASAKVLVVDDNKINSRLLSRMIARLEPMCNVQSCHNGEEALKLVESVAADGEQFDVIFMDVNMPVMDGLQATQAIRAQGIMWPIVAITANALTTDTVICLRAGMNAVLSKPFRKEDVKRCLNVAVVEHGWDTVPLSILESNENFQ